METKVDLWLEENKPKGMLYNGDFYYVSKKEKKQVSYHVELRPTPIKVTKTRKRRSRGNGAEKGERITKVGHSYIYENVLKDFKKAIKKGTSTRAVFLKYSPTAKGNTLKSYRTLYSRYLRENENHIIKPRAKKTIIRGKKYRRPPPKGAYKYSKTYQTWIRKEEADKVMKAIRTVEYGWKPTSDNIAQRAGMARHRVLATLSVLQDEDRVGYETKKLTPVYFDKGFVSK